MKKISPQQGTQTKFLASTADICIFGGAAGGGKSYALLLEPLRYANVHGFNSVIFRKNYTQITAAGGLWDTSLQLYSLLPFAVPFKSPKLHWLFHNRAKLSFDYLARDEDVYKWQGAQIAFLGFDELTHFSESQFFYMLSRNRSACGVKPYVRATCNPDVDSWVANFIAWWIDTDTGYPIKERSGQKRYFARLDGEIIWGDTRVAVAEKCKIDARLCKSVTFIASNIHDNKALLSVNPDYLASLNALSLVERERLLKGNWKIRPAAGLYFKREQTRIVKSVPDKIVFIVRAWDLAATEITSNNRDPDRTAGCLMARLKNGQYIILDAKRIAANASTVRNLVKNTAATDRVLYKCNNISLPQDPGQAGKEQAQSYIKELAGYMVTSNVISANKIARAEPFAAQWQQGNVLLLEGAWNEPFLSELEGFPDALHDDQVDAASDAFRLVAVTSDWRGWIT